MYPSDAYDDVDHDDDELPELPIPRPGEQRAPRATNTTPLRAPKLGGGASYTASDSTSATPAVPLSGGARDAEDTWAKALSEAERADRASADETRFTWELAARLTQGMLANPGRQHVSVKDAMGLFDQFLTEMQTYSRITRANVGADEQASSPTDTSEGRRRAEHGEYFQAAAKAAAPQPTRIFEPRPDPRITPAITHAPDEDPALPQQPAATQQPVGAQQPVAQQPSAPKPEPRLPQPGEGYQAIPPGARYVPGSMAGPPPAPTSPEEDAAPGPARDDRAA